ncbi:MAG: hypothetical protein KA099_01525 [Alphaproteobacteria bacterium]|nr:hypothetical protein [Alphaproteobacteria bacterium]MBP7758656.1 hypothetical protein [Alphaproteobacteria bacterium]MBP7761684.1 hypothetical protein [Alphaproteobacteria bacterium]MBP7903981.1 hypothetical protein [Alphaproteobacteria bacterium]
MKRCFGLLFFFSISFVTAAFADKAEVDFRKFSGQDAYAWLAERNFMLERSADNRKKTKISLTDQGLTIEALKPAQSIIALKKGKLTGDQDVEIVWGVNKFPAGASYQNGRRNEAIMFYAFFGKEMIDSGSAIVPDSPYFIALHLCENDPIGAPLKGRFYHKGGRFICAAHPQPGEVVTTRLNLKKTFKDIFGVEPPPLSGIAFEFDTTKPKDDGTSSAFVQSVRFPEATYIQED